MAVELELKSCIIEFINPHGLVQMVSNTYAGETTSFEMGEKKYELVLVPMNDGDREQVAPEWQGNLGLEADLIHDDWHYLHGDVYGVTGSNAFFSISLQNSTISGWIGGGEPTFIEPLPGAPGIHVVYHQEDIEDYSFGADYLAPSHVQSNTNIAASGGSAFQSCLGHCENYPLLKVKVYFESQNEKRTILGFRNILQDALGVTFRVEKYEKIDASDLQSWGKFTCTTGTTMADMASDYPAAGVGLNREELSIFMLDGSTYANANGGSKQDTFTNNLVGCGTAGLVWVNTIGSLGKKQEILLHEVGHALGASHGPSPYSLLMDSELHSERHTCTHQHTHEYYGIMDNGGSWGSCKNGNLIRSKNLEFHTNSISAMAGLIDGLEYERTFFPLRFGTPAFSMFGSNMMVTNERDLNPGDSVYAYHQFWWLQGDDDIGHQFRAGHNFESCTAASCSVATPGAYLRTYPESTSYGFVRNWAKTNVPSGANSIIVWTNMESNYNYHWPHEEIALAVS